MARVLVLDAGQRSALAVVRSLGRRDIPVLTADDRPFALAGCSRYSHDYSMIPSPSLNPEGFVAGIAGLCREKAVDVVLPMIELTAALLLKHQTQLPGVKLPLADLHVIDSLADKCSLMRMAESLDIPIPRTWYADSPETLPCPLAELPYPLVLKPGKSWLKLNGQWHRNTVQFARSPHEAQQILTSSPAFSVHPFLLQSRIDGHGQGIFALYDNGRPLAFFAHRRVREKPPRGGVSVLSESIPIDQTLLDHTRSLLDAKRWHGVAMVEFKVAPDGSPYLMEVNTRFWGSLQLAIDAGVDFPWLLYRLACGEHPDPADSYRTGARLRWLLGDLDSLYLTLKDAEYSMRAKLQALLAFALPSFSGCRHEVNRWNDLKPFLCELRQYLQDIRR